MNDKTNGAMVRRPSSAVEKIAPGAKRILSGMVADTLDLIQAQETESIFKLGKNYYFGEGIPKDFVAAARLFRKAAEKDHAGAQNGLGECYREGRGVSQDYIEAAKWFRSAAKKNHAKAQHNLGFCYETGKGVEKDYSQAVNWYRKATEQDYAWALLSLANCYEIGCGVPQDSPEAYKLYKLANNDNMTQKEFRDVKESRIIIAYSWASIKTRMTDAEIAEGEHRYHEYCSQKNSRE